MFNFNELKNFVFFISFLSVLTLLVILIQLNDFIYHLQLEDSTFLILMWTSPLNSMPIYSITFLAFEYLIASSNITYLRIPKLYPTLSYSFFISLKASQFTLLLRAKLQILSYSLLFLSQYISIPLDGSKFYLQNMFFPGLGKIPRRRESTYSSILAWRIPWTVQPLGLQRVRHN